MKKLSTKVYLSGNNIYHLNLFSKLYHLDACLDRDRAFFSSPSETSFNLIYQGNLIQGEGSDSLKTALETRGKTA